MRANLRDQRRSYRRAEIIVVTKCAPDLSEAARRKIIADIKPLPHQQVFFTTIEYGQPYHILTQEKRDITAEDEILLVCGIANPKPLKQYLADRAAIYYQQDYSDHHIFSIDDLKDIRKRFGQLNGRQKFVLTTEKDAVRLLKFSQELASLPLFVLPIRHRFLFGEAEQFNRAVVDFIEQFQTNAVS